jgi:hypothetical protein
VVLRASVRRGIDGGEAESTHERVLILGLLSLPIVMYVAEKLTHGGMINRYAISTVLAYPVGVGLILAKMSRRSVVLLAAFMLVVVAARDAAFWAAHRDHLVGVTSPAGDMEKLVNSSDYRELPVVITTDYALVDLQKSFEYEGSDTIDRLDLALRSVMPLHIYEFHQFTSTHSSFLLYSAGNFVSAGTSTFYDWLTPELVRDGYTVQVVAADQNRRLYLVMNGKLQ